MPSGWPLGPVQLHHPLESMVQEAGEPGAVAAGPLDRPHPPAGLLVGQLQEPLVAGRSGRHGQGGQALAGGRGDHRSGWVCLWVSTPMTSSMVSASMVMRCAPCPETTWTVPVRDLSSAGL
jgi:hypothetical protein